VNVLLATVGSLGDLHPVLGIGQALSTAGVRVFLISHPHYRERTISAGLKFIGAGPKVHLFEEIRKNPQFLDPQSAPLAVWNEFVLPAVKDFYQVTRDAIDRYQPVFVASHFLTVGTLLAASQAGLPRAVLMTTPTGWLSSADIVINGWSWPVFSRPVFRLLREKIFLYCSRSLKKVCEDLEIPWYPRIAEATLREVELNLGLWSPYFRPATADDPPRAIICGFCRQIFPAERPASLKGFFREDQPPVVVTFGSAACLHASDLYPLIASACRYLKWRCLLLGPGLEKLTEAPNILTADYLPYESIFSQARLIIHHGGINTVAAALQAGQPQLILPFCHDQFDNAARCVRLGVALKLDRYRLSQELLVSALKKIVENKALYQAARKVSEIINREASGARVAAFHLLALARSVDA